MGEGASILEAVIFTQPQGCVLMAFTELILLPCKVCGVVRSAQGRLQRLRQPRLTSTDPHIVSIKQRRAKTSAQTTLSVPFYMHFPCFGRRFRKPTVETTTRKEIWTKRRNRARRPLPNLGGAPLCFSCPK